MVNILINKIINIFCYTIFKIDFAKKKHTINKKMHLLKNFSNKFYETILKKKIIKNDRHKS